MKKITLTFLVCLVFIISSVTVYAAEKTAEKPIRVFFIGNSLTYSYDVPRQFAEFAKQAGHNVEYDFYAPGGSSFQDHAKNPLITQLLKGQNWDYVVLQEHSQRPGWAPHQVKQEVILSADILVQTIKAANKNSQVVYYETMARKYGDPRNVHNVPELATYEGMQARVNGTYHFLAKRHDAILAPVGEVWAQMRKKYPQIELYSDDVHQNKMGAYLSGCTIFAAIFQENCNGGLADIMVTKGQGRIVREVVQDVVSNNK